MGQADLQINQKARRVLVRHWIDLGHISMRSTNGKLTIRGSLSRIYGHSEVLTPSLVETIFRELRRIPGIKHVHTDLENWVCDGGAWRPKEAPRTKPASATTSSAESETTYIIEEDE